MHLAETTRHDADGSTRDGSAREGLTRRVRHETAWFPPGAQPRRRRQSIAVMHFTAQQADECACVLRTSKVIFLLNKSSSPSSWERLLPTYRPLCLEHQQWSSGTGKASTRRDLLPTHRPLTSSTSNGARGQVKRVREEKLSSIYTFRQSLDAPTNASIPEGSRRERVVIFPIFIEGSQGRSVDHGARRIKRDQIALVPVVVVSPTFNVPPLGLDRAPAMELGDRSRLSDQCDVHSRTGLGQTKRTGRPRRRQEAPTPNVSLSTSSKSFPLPWSTP